MKTIVIIFLNIFTNNKAKHIHCNLQCCIFVYVSWLMQLKGILIYHFGTQKNPLAAKPKELVTDWPLTKKIKLEGC